MQVPRWIPLPCFPDQNSPGWHQSTPRVVIPMHYRGETFGFDVLGTVEAFADMCEVVVEYPGAFLELTKETEPHTAVLKLNG